MNTVALSDFLPQLSLYADQCPEIVATIAIRNACIDFCKRTEISREYLSPITIQTGQQDYPLLPLPDTRVLSIVYAVADGVPIHPLSSTDQDGRGEAWRSQEITSRYSQDNSGSIRLAWAPTTTINDGLVLRASLAPTQSASECDEMLLNDWYEQIAAGAAAKLLVMPKKAWTNPALSDYCKGIYESAVTDAIARLARGFTRAPQFVTPPRTI